jgi:hypothetical protein
MEVACKFAREKSFLKYKNSLSAINRYGTELYELIEVLVVMTKRRRYIRAILELEDVDPSIFLLSAVVQNNHDVVKAILKLGIRADAGDNFALLSAAEGSDIGIVKLLVMSGSRPETNDGEAVSAALKAGKTHVASYLLRMGKFAPSFFNEMTILASSLNCAEIVKLLISSKDISHKAIVHSLWLSAARGHVRVVKLIARHARLYSDEWSAAIMLAEQMGKLDVSKFLKNAVDTALSRTHEIAVSVEEFMFLNDITLPTPPCASPVSR